MGHGCAYTPRSINSTFHSEIKVPIIADLLILLKVFQGEIFDLRILIYALKIFFSYERPFIGKTTYVERKPSGVRISKLIIIDKIKCSLFTKHIVSDKAQGETSQ